MYKIDAEMERRIAAAVAAMPEGWLEDSRLRVDARLAEVARNDAEACFSFETVEAGFPRFWFWGNDTYKFYSQSKFDGSLFYTKQNSAENVFRIFNEDMTERNVARLAEQAERDGKFVAKVK